MEYYITQPKDYWIAPNAVSITLNALGDKNRIQGSVASGAVVMCFVESIKAESEGGEQGNGDGLWYDSDHEPKRWPLSLSPTYFNSDTHKYVYVAIPRSTTIGTQAVVVFPSELLDIYGRVERTESGTTTYEQVGSTDYFYVYLNGIIGAAGAVAAGKREWEDPITDRDWGILETAQGREERQDNTDWYTWSSVSQTVTFLKKIVMSATSWFQNLIIGTGTTQGNLTGVAKTGATTQQSGWETHIVTPKYLDEFGNTRYLRKDVADTASGKITFEDGLGGADDAFSIDSDGNASFAGDIEAAGDIDVEGAATIGGNTEINGSATIGGEVQAPMVVSDNYNNDGSEGLVGGGFVLTNDKRTIYPSANAQHSRLEVDEMVVRMKAVFAELEVRKFVAMGGNYVFSPAASIIEGVDPVAVSGSTITPTTDANATHYRCWLHLDDGTTQTVNTWQRGMLARCQTFNVSNGAGSHTDSETGATENAYYWRLVDGVGETTWGDGVKHGYVLLAKFYADSGSDIPRPMDSIVCFGAASPTYISGATWTVDDAAEWSNLIMIETLGEDAPAIKEYHNIGIKTISAQQPIDWSVANCLYTRISPVSGNIFRGPEFYVTNDNGTDWQITASNIYSKVQSILGGNIASESYVDQSAEQILSVVKTEGHRNYFGFNGAVKVDSLLSGQKAIKAVQPYGLLLVPNGSVGQAGVRINNLGLPATGNYTVSGEIKMATAARTVSFSLGGGETETFSVTTAWQDFAVTLTLSSISDDYLTVSSLATQLLGSDNYILIRHLKIERGDTATDFCIANEDATYSNNNHPMSIGLQNLTETTDSTCPSGQKVYVPDSYPADDAYTNYAVDVTSVATKIKAGKVYTLSFWARSTTGNHVISSYLYSYLVSAYGYFKDYDHNLQRQTELVSQDGYTLTRPTTAWRQYFVYFYAESVPTEGLIAMRLDGTISYDGADNTTGTLYVSGFDFCEGYISANSAATSSSFSEIKQTADSISLRVTQDLAYTGIDIANRKITLTTDNLSVVNNQDVPTFGLDSEGNITIKGKIEATSLHHSAKVFNGTNGNAYEDMFIWREYDGSGGYEDHIAENNGTTKYHKGDAYGNDAVVIETWTQFYDVCILGPNFTGTMYLPVPADHPGVMIDFVVRSSAANNTMACSDRTASNVFRNATLAAVGTLPLTDHIRVISCKDTNSIWAWIQMID